MNSFKSLNKKIVAFSFMSVIVFLAGCGHDSSVSQTKVVAPADNTVSASQPANVTSSNGTPVVAVPTTLPTNKNISPAQQNNAQATVNELVNDLSSLK